MSQAKGVIGRPSPIVFDTSIMIVAFFFITFLICLYILPISFKYFETSVKDEQLEFSYQLKDGISNDRLGYLILIREKVVEMLEKL